MWGQQRWPHGTRSSWMAGSQIQDPALMRGAGGARLGPDKANTTALSPNPLGDMLGRDWCRRRGKRSRCDVNLLSLRTCNTVFIECLVVDAHCNVAIRVGI